MDKTGEYVQTVGVQRSPKAHKHAAFITAFIPIKHFDVWELSQKIFYITYAVILLTHRVLEKIFSVI